MVEEETGTKKIQQAMNNENMNDFIPNIEESPELAAALGRMRRKFWQCQNSSCARVVPNPYRWVNGAETKFACPYCSSLTVEIDK